MEEISMKILFSLGLVVATPAALDEMEQARQSPAELLNRHKTGDWGDLCEDDCQANTLALEQGERILSAYELSTGSRVYVITEWNRSATTILLPSEY